MAKAGATVPTVAHNTPLMSLQVSSLQVNMSNWHVKGILTTSKKQKQHHTNSISTLKSPEEIINFAEELTIAEGDEQENVTAYPFQCFILGSLNGWRTKEKGHRRFRTSYVQLGRQNGKSFINGILACYYGNFDGYKYGKIFCTATKQDQANIVFDEIVKFINSDEDLSEWFKVHEHNHTIDCLCTHSEIKALSGDTKSLDGHRAYLGIVDEYHAHKTNQMYKLLEGGIKKLKSALISVITTAGVRFEIALLQVI